MEEYGGTLRTMSKHIATLHNTTEHGKNGGTWQKWQNMAKLVEHGKTWRKIGFTWVHLGSLGFTHVQSSSLEFAWVHLGSLSFTWV